MGKATKYLTIVIYTLAILFMAWVLFSFINVNSINITNGTEASWNFFSLLTKIL